MTQEEFYNNMSSWIETDIETWNHITMLGYFCWKYQKKHNVNFVLVRSKKGVESSKESADFAKLFKLMAPENYASLSKEEKAKIRKDVNLKIKNYINWVFDYKYRYGDKSVNGTRLFLVPSMINEFERMYNNFLLKKTEQNKFNELVCWCRSNAKDIFDLVSLDSKDDLKYLNKYIEQYNVRTNSIELVVKKAKELELI